MVGGVAIGLILFAAAAVDVEGATSCPSAAAVAARLADLLPDLSPANASGATDGASSGESAAGPVRDRARLMDHNDHLVIVLENASGVVLATRRLPRTFPCDDLASAAAVAIATAVSDVHPDFAPALASRQSALAPVLSAPVLAPPPSVESAGNWAWAAGAGVGFGGSPERPDAAWDATVGFWLARAPGRTWWRAGLEGQSRRDLALQGGQASWQRLALGLGVEQDLLPEATWGKARLRGFVLARLAWLNLRGEGFALNHRDDTVDPGLGAGLRAVVPAGRWSTWAELAVSYWPIGHQLVGPGTDSPGRLPAADIFLRLGVAIASLP